jgi:hypothetical protein
MESRAPPFMRCQIPWWWREEEKSVAVGGEEGDVCGGGRRGRRRLRRWPMMTSAVVGGGGRMMVAPWAGCLRPLCAMCRCGDAEGLLGQVQPYRFFSHSPSRWVRR